MDTSLTSPFPEREPTNLLGEMLEIVSGGMGSSLWGVGHHGKPSIILVPHRIKAVPQPMRAICEAEMTAEPES